MAPFLFILKSISDGGRDCWKWIIVLELTKRDQMFKCVCIHAYIWSSWNVCIYTRIYDLHKMTISFPDESIPEVIIFYNRRTYTPHTPHHIASHRIASHRIASHRIASHRIASHRIASHRIASRRIASHRIASHRITAHHITPRHATPHHATPCHAMPCHAMPCHAMPRHATPRHATPRHATPRTPRHATRYFWKSFEISERNSKHKVKKLRVLSQLKFEPYNKLFQASCKIHWIDIIPFSKKL